MSPGHVHENERPRTGSRQCGVERLVSLGGFLSNPNSKRRLSPMQILVFSPQFRKRSRAIS
jgi:hypothetical protein